MPKSKPHKDWENVTYLSQAVDFQNSFSTATTKVCILKWFTEVKLQSGSSTRAPNYKAYHYRAASQSLQAHDRFPSSVPDHCLPSSALPGPHSPSYNISVSLTRPLLYFLSPHPQSLKSLLFQTAPYRLIQWQKTCQLTVALLGNESPITRSHLPPRDSRKNWRNCTLEHQLWVSSPASHTQDNLLSMLGSGSSTRIPQTWSSEKTTDTNL